VNDALREGTDIGLVVDQSQLDQGLRHLDNGRKEGANSRRVRAADRNVPRTPQAI